MADLKSLQMTTRVHLKGVQSVLRMLSDIGENSLMTLEAAEMKEIMKDIKAAASETENKKFKTFLNQLIKDCEGKIYKTVDK